MKISVRSRLKIRIVLIYQKIYLTDNRYKIAK